MWVVEFDAIGSAEEASSGLTAAAQICSAESSLDLNESMLDQLS